jgi:hypothetical protein
VASVFHWHLPSGKQNHINKMKLMWFDVLTEREHAIMIEVDG